MVRAKRSKNTILSKLRNFFLIVFIIIFVVSLYKIIMWKLNNMKNEQILQEVEQSVTVEEDEFKIDFNELKEKNSETVAWLKVNGTNIEYPIVQAKNNDYYMDNNFNKESNVGGWVFADYRNKLDGTDKNIVVYGHNMRDRSMFGSLENILKEDWYNNKENYTIKFITENENAEYQVFSVYEIESEDYYITTKFTGAEFKKYIDTVKGRSIKDFDVEVTENDNILTLSTCGNNNYYRVVLHANKIKVHGK